MQIIDEQLVAKVIAPRKNNSYKSSYGRIMLIGGFENYHGAIILAASAAVYGGTGLVSVLTTPETITALNMRLPEAMGIPDTQDYLSLIPQQDVIVIGPGLGTSMHALAILKNVLQAVTDKQCLVIDGSALTLLASNNLELPTTKLTVLTPHQMEWQRISKLSLNQQTPSANQTKTNQLNVTVIVKKYQSELYQPHLEAKKILVGGPYQATGGMGDTLAGIVGCFLSQFSADGNTIAAALYLHSAIAQDIAQNQYVVLPSQISMALPTAMAKYSKLS